MLTLLRQLPFLQNKKYVLSSFRCIYSGRIPPILFKRILRDSSRKDAKKKGYGEKEICLLNEIDIRTPLPGNMGGLPLQLLYTTKIRNLPMLAGDDWKASLQLPEEKFKAILFHYAFEDLDTIKSNTKDVDCVAHKCPILVRRDFLNLFPHRHLGETLTLLTVCVKADNDMSTWSEEAEEEREKLVQYFVAAAKTMTEFLGKKEYWADFIDPRTGKPHFSPLVDDVMFETDLRYCNFGLKIEDLGCCKIISHTVWGRNVFNGVIFTNAPFKVFES